MDLPSPLSAKDKNSFAYPTMKDRIPVIISKIVDHLNRNRDRLTEMYNGPNSNEELKTIIGAMSCLRYEVMTNKPAVLLKDCGEDTPEWNDDLKKQTIINGGECLKWFDSPWLWMECYMYRRIQEAVKMSSSFSTFDVFGDQKKNAFHNSYSAISALTMHLFEVTKSFEKSGENIDKHFKEFLQISLWGNKCDLSISAGQELNQTENPVQQSASLMSNILVDHTDSILSLFHRKKEILNNKGAKVTIVLDNAGFEFMTDLCLAAFLFTSGLASSVHFHGKSMPWFVSDVTKQDVDWIFQQMAAVNHCGMNQLIKKLNHHVCNSTITFEFDPFWTMAHSFCKMESVCPELYSKLRESDIVIFKGDLNYRKLVGDLNWDTTAEFSQALQGFHPTAVCSLRTLKADVVVGLKPGQAEELSAVDAGWMTNGNWAVISLDAP